MEAHFFTLISRWFQPRYNARLQLLEAQIRILRARVDAVRIVPTPAEKSELLRIGAALGHVVADVMHVVKPESYRRWVRQSRRGVEFKPSGRPRTPMATVNLVLRMAEENLRWGYRKIVGELKKLGIPIGTTTVRKILKDFGVLPAPDKAFKKPVVTWTRLFMLTWTRWSRPTSSRNASTPFEAFSRQRTRLHPSGQPQGVLQPSDLPSRWGLGYATSM